MKNNFGYKDFRKDVLECFSSIISKYNFKINDERLAQEGNAKNIMVFTHNDYCPIFSSNLSGFPYFKYLTIQNC